VPYGPEEPKGIWAGRFLASSASSCTDFQGAEAGTASSVGSASTRATGASCFTSYAGFLSKSRSASGSTAREDRVIRMV
jgi:hypothetical protein